MNCSVINIALLTCLGLCGVAVRAQIPPFIEECVHGKYPPSTSSKVPTYVINLDLPPKERWTQVAKEKGPQIAHLVKSLKSFLAEWSPTLEKTIIHFIDSHTENLVDSVPYPFGPEMIGVAQDSGVLLGEVVLYNIFYEVFSMCTSIVAEAPDGKLYHARNLDFGLFMGWEAKNHSWMITDALRPLIINLDFQSKGKTVFKSVNFAGYIGIFTAIKPGVFTMSMNERFALNGGYVGILEWMLGMHSSKWVGFLGRSVLENATSYSEAKEILSKTPLLSPAYFILGGNQSGEASIITRARDKALDVWDLGKKNSSWYLLETNYDNWKKPLFIDDRRTPAHKCMDKLTQKGAGFAGIFDVLSSRPMLNKLTTYTALMQVNAGTLETYLQYCPDPCPPF